MQTQTQTQTAMPDTTVRAAKLLLDLLKGMDDLKKQIANVIGEHDALDLSLGKDGLSFVAKAILKPGDDGKIAAHMLGRNSVPGVCFVDIETRPVPKTAMRRELIAKVVSPKGDTL